MKHSDHADLSVSAEELMQPALAAGQVVLANIKQLDTTGAPIVSYFLHGQSHCQSAVSTTAISAADVGRQVALTFINGDLKQPLILGLVYSPFYDYLEQVEIAPQTSAAPSELVPASHEVSYDGDGARAELNEPIKVDGKQVIIEGKEQVELRCGEASITLTKSGRVLIRGKYLLNRASGVNRIVGGSVQVN